MTIRQMLEKILDAHISMALDSDPVVLRKAIAKFTYWMDQLRERLRKLGIDWEE